ncbi:MAG TPA: EAL domain-containing protein, partial [Ilumatobacteraceae bacterium]
ITITFATLLLAGEVFPLKFLRLDETGQITSSWAFAFAILLVEPTLIAVAAIAVASLVADSIQRKRFSRLVFNAGQLSLSLAAAGAVLDLTGQRGVLTDPTRSLGPAWLLGTVAAGLTLLVANGVMMWLAMVLSGEMTVSQALRQGLTSNSPTDGALLALAPGVVAVCERSVLLLPLALLTALIVHLVARRSLDREHEATHDSLTDLFNRRAFIDQLDAALADTVESEPCLAVLVLDLDGFKAVNDTLGHHIGDQILGEVASRITALHGNGQISARLGGDEFATLMTDLATPAEAISRARTLHAALAEPYTSFGFPVQLTASIGVAMLSAENNTPGALLRAADIAMYAAKRDSLGVQLQSRQETGHEIGRLSLIGELSEAMARGELFVEYQPQATCMTRQVFGFEALLRWQHPRRGLIQPAEFMPLAEQTELMQPITQFVLGEALREVAGWRARGWNVRVAINVSAQNLHNSHFPDLVARMLAEAGLPGNVIELEITENAVMTKREVIRDVLRRLRELGMRIVIDDFGTGYSSLANMRLLPLDGVKIDRSFISDLDENRDDKVIVSSIIELAHNLHLEATAEGVETDATWKLLADLGCDHIQGYRIARPMPAPLVHGWLQRYRAERTAEVRPPRHHLQLVNGS